MDNEQAIIIQFNYGFDDLGPYFDLSDKLDKVAKETGLGEYDGHEIALDYSDGFFYLYAPDAERFYKVIEPTLKGASFMQGAAVTLRFGPPEDGVSEIDFILN
jgi:hypothetical protein